MFSYGRAHIHHNRGTEREGAGIGREEERGIKSKVRIGYLPFRFLEPILDKVVSLELIVVGNIGASIDGADTVCLFLRFCSE